MKTILQTCEPRPEVLSGELREGILAARLRDVIDGSADPVYGDPRTFFDETYPTAFIDQAVCGLQRHGYPWGALLKLAFEPGLAPRQEDAYFARTADEKRDALKGRFAQLKEEARKIVGLLRTALASAQEPDGGTPDLCAAVL